MTSMGLSLKLRMKFYYRDFLKVLMIPEKQARIDQKLMITSWQP